MSSASVAYQYGQDEDEVSSGICPAEFEEDQLNTRVLMPPVGFEASGASPPAAVAAPAGVPRADRDLIRSCWRALVAPGEVHEVRIVSSRKNGPNRLFGTVSGYFNDEDAFVSSVGRVTGADAEAVYVTLNPVNPDLQARAVNRLKSSARETTADVDIRYRHNMLIDVDPKRPSGVSATDEERAAALKVRDQVQEFLAEFGWPAPVAVTESGNGGGLIYRVNLPNNADSTRLIENVLKGIATAFDSPEVTIDTNTANAARITKVVGTIAAKGDNVPDRPWRLATGVFPPDADKVARDLLDAIAALSNQPDLEQSQKMSDWSIKPSKWDVRDVLRARGITWIERDKQYGTVLKLDRCLTSDDHTDGACIVVRPNGAVGYRCHHNRCADKHWADARVSLGMEPRSLSPLGWQSNERGRSHALRLSPGGAATWPAPLAPEALHGLAGEIVRAIEPHTEGDPAAVLVNFLVAFGSAAGRAPHAMVGASRHGSNLFAVMVGETSKGRKGTAWSEPRRLVHLADGDWATNRIVSGLSSGEGLIWVVRDPIEKTERAKKRDEWVAEYDTVIVDAGVGDKRLLVIEEEFASTLKVASREGNTLSPIVRQAWDGHDLRVLTKNSPAVATAPHVGIIGHVTKDELLRQLDGTEVANGFANRFLWLCVRRSKVLPDGGQLPDAVVENLARRVARALSFAHQAGEMRRDDAARALWAEIYPDLSDGAPGMLGAVTNRAEAQVLRLSLIYALLDESLVIKLEHLRAALAVWNYCEASAEYIFGDATGDPVADRILTALRSQGPLTQTDISNLFGRHAQASRIDQALKALQGAGLVSSMQEATEGRTRTVWSAT